MAPARPQAQLRSKFIIDSLVCDSDGIIYYSDILVSLSSIVYCNVLEYIKVCYSISIAYYFIYYIVYSIVYYIVY